jgi:hypothetical protein
LALFHSYMDFYFYNQKFTIKRQLLHQLGRPPSLTVCLVSCPSFHFEVRRFHCPEWKVLGFFFVHLSALWSYQLFACFFPIGANILVSTIQFLLLSADWLLVSKAFIQLKSFPEKYRKHQKELLDIDAREFPKLL